MNQSVEVQRYIESMMTKLALGDMKECSFQEAMEICHWLGRRVRPIGQKWYLSATLIGGRYAVRYDSGDEYVTIYAHTIQKWEVIN